LVKQIVAFECDSRVAENFRSAVFQKNKKLYGVLGPEFIEALKDRTKLLEKEMKK
jgi:hypothetical protein